MFLFIFYHFYCYLTKTHMRNMKTICEMPVIKIISIFCLNYEHIKNMQILSVCPWCLKYRKHCGQCPQGQYDGFRLASD